MPQRGAGGLGGSHIAPQTAKRRMLFEWLCGSLLTQCLVQLCHLWVVPACRLGLVTGRKIEGNQESNWELSSCHERLKKDLASPGSKSPSACRHWGCCTPVSPLPSHSSMEDAHRTTCCQAPFLPASVPPHMGHLSRQEKSGFARLGVTCFAGGQCLGQSAHCPPLLIGP